MKNLLLISLLTLLTSAVYGQTRYARYVDSAGYDQISTVKMPAVAMSGLFAHLLSKPTTMSGYGITDGLTSSSNIAWSKITGAPSIPTVPTNVSAFTNDASYINSSQFTSGVKWSATTQTLAYGGNYQFNGTANTTATLPAVSSTIKYRYYLITVKNESNYTVTIVSNTGANDIMDVGAVSSITIMPGQAVELCPDGIYFTRS